MHLTFYTGLFTPPHDTGHHQKKYIIMTVVMQAQKIFLRLNKTSLHYNWYHFVPQGWQQKEAHKEPVPEVHKEI